MTDSDSEDIEKQKEYERLRYENRKREIRPRIQYESEGNIKEEIFSRKVKENLTEFFKNHQELESVKILDLGIFHKDKKISYGDGVIYHMICETLDMILNIILNTNIKHVNFLSDYKEKNLDLRNFAWGLTRFAEKNKTLETIIMTGVDFNPETKSRIRHFIITNKTKLSILTDFSNDIDILTERENRLSLIPAKVVLFIGVFGTKARIRLPGNEIPGLDNKLILILNARENTYSNTLEYNFATEGNNNSGTIETKDNEVIKMSISLGGYYQIKKENDIFVCEIQKSGGYKACYIYERTVILNNFNIEIE